MSRWGDADEDDYLPPPKTTPVDPKTNIKVRTSYSLTPGGQKQKTTEKIKVSVQTTRVAKEVARRQANWVRFGNASGTEGNDAEEENITIQSKDEVRIEDPNGEGDADDEDGAKVRRLIDPTPCPPSNAREDDTVARRNCRALKSQTGHVEPSCSLTLKNHTHTHTHTHARTLNTHYNSKNPALSSPRHLLAT